MALNFSEGLTDLTAIAITHYWQWMYVSSFYDFHNIFSLCGSKKINYLLQRKKCNRYFQSTEYVCVSDNGKRFLSHQKNKTSFFFHLSYRSSIIIQIFSGWNYNSWINSCKKSKSNIRAIFFKCFHKWLECRTWRYQQ